MTYIKNMFSYASISSNTTLLEGYHYNCTGSITLTLPAIASILAGSEIRIKNTGTGTLTISSNDSDETIDGSSSNYELDVQYSAITLVSNGVTDWEII
jgi:hypothetical protein